MQADRQITLIEEAHARVEGALNQWDATNSERVLACQKTLEQAAETVGRMFPVAPDMSSESRLRLRNGVLVLKEELNRLELLVDSASAFLRVVHGAPTAPMMYAADGRLRSERTEYTGVEA